MEKSTPSQVVSFGPFQLDLVSGELHKHGLKIKLQELPFRVLALLLEHPGEVVTREELRRTLWPDTFVDFDHSLASAINKIREALSDSAENARFIETLPRRGYRFIAPVSGLSGRPHDRVALASRPTIQEIPAASPHETPVEPSGPASKRTRHALVVGALGLAVLALLAITYVMTRSRAADATRPKIKSLAVLPLKNLSGDPTQEYLADGMTEALIGRLSRIGGLRVISRTSVMPLKDTRLSVPEIARTLGVDAIVEGSIIREGSQIRVRAQLIRAATDDHIWTEEYHREYRSILGLQEEVARSISQRIEISLTPDGRASLAPTNTADPEAHEDYLKGRYYFNQRTPDALNKSIAHFRQAIARDPGYASAYSGLADAYALLGFRGGLPSKDALVQAKAAAQKAIELDNTLAEPHASLAFIAETHEWDWATAEREYKRALELNPGDARAHHWYAGYLMYVGRFEEGIAEARRARDLDPLSLPVNNALAGRLLVAGRVDAAMEQLHKTLEMNPHFGPAHQTLGWAYLNRGMHEDAIRAFQQALQLSGSSDTDLLLDLGFAYATAGHRDEARRILAKLEKLHQQGLVPSGSIAILYGALGNLNEAFAWLEKAYQERDPQLTYLKVPGRRYEPLRHDPRFTKLLLRMGLAE